jgi:hypothetical protein
MQQYSPARKQAHATMRLTRPTGQFPSPRTCQAPHADRACHRSRSARPPPPCPTAPPTGSRQRPQFLRRPYPRRPWAEAEAKQVFSSLSISPRLRASSQGIDRRSEPPRSKADDAFFLPRETAAGAGPLRLPSGPVVAATSFACRLRRSLTTLPAPTATVPQRRRRFPRRPTAPPWRRFSREPFSSPTPQTDSLPSHPALSTATAPPSRRRHRPYALELSSPVPIWPGRIRPI